MMELRVDHAPKSVGGSKRALSDDGMAYAAFIAGVRARFPPVTYPLANHCSRMLIVS
jgi:hypothetical protein